MVATDQGIFDLAFRVSEFFQLPIEAIFSRQPFRPLSEAVYQRSAEETTTTSPRALLGAEYMNGAAVNRATLSRWRVRVIAL